MGCHFNISRSWTIFNPFFLASFQLLRWFYCNNPIIIQRQLWTTTYRIMVILSTICHQRWNFESANTYSSHNEVWLIKHILASPKLIISTMKKVVKFIDYHQKPFIKSQISTKLTKKSQDRASLRDGVLH